MSSNSNMYLLLQWVLNGNKKFYYLIFKVFGTKIYCWYLFTYIVVKYLDQSILIVHNFMLSVVTNYFLIDDVRVLIEKFKTNIVFSNI